MYGKLKKLGRWGELHEESEELAIRATALRITDPERARELYLEAAVKEEEVLGCFSREEKGAQKWYESFVVSAAALYFKGEDYEGSRRIIEEHSKDLKIEYYRERLEEVVDALAEIN
ncbi:hypothetical protein J4216_02230 [Candidatus Woesearchaeota archaeon]|nr:hypothetical protein [Candidatus Woesearchaeota archaeon]